MIAVVRIVLLILFFLLSTVAGLLICLVRPFHPNNVYIFSHWYGWAAWIFGLKVEIRQHNGADIGQPCVYIANHQNNLDLFTISNAVELRTVTIGKKSLKFIPFFGQLYWLSGNILIDRQNKSRALGAMLGAAERIGRDKISVWMFPEGTRSYGRGLLPFKMGAFHIALEANVPVVPVCMSSTHGQFKLNRWNNGKVIVQIMAPQTLQRDQVNIREFAQNIHQQMQQQIALLDSELGNDYTANNIKAKE
ncbi:1-acylglycerol-3-phosphate O-acyltransferase [Rheinheimera baltica]|uniref:1-acylglycerol-3-phosphate O-acyltransferase n=1 Tax=Rheinheimera baltica TaxID=67576 RepID=UPI0003F71E32|nr:1-acylglycerol-3-phosphate O-acyltransferase [Rheinheimera baltica]MDP5150484.1 1-acylglycerol-3-phosphate O-acyltransferase [Rheinheimera baltica]MDP5190739.1 1-acylglycerol-3-phosphate O-acyltransferase [Rheinheimera baltica]